MGLEASEIRRRAAELKADDAALRGRTREALEAEYRRSHRVSDTREMSKRDLRDAILRDRYGQEAMTEAFAPKRGRKAVAQ